MGKRSSVISFNRHIKFVILFYLLAFSIAGRARARTFADCIGINVKFSQGQPQTELPLLENLGVHWVRDSVNWSEMELTAGHYEAFPEAFRQRLAFYKTHKIGVVFGLWYDNPKAYPNSPARPANSTDPEAYGKYAAEIARQLKLSGVRFVIELYNEPHNSLNSLGGNFNGKPPSPWLDRYVSMVQSAVKQIKAFDPGVRVLSDDDMWIIHYWYLEKGLPSQLDGFAVHPYVKSWPEFAAVSQDTDWVRPFDVVDADRSLASSVRRLRDHGAEKLGHTPAIWATEWGWPIGDAVEGSPMTEDVLAGLLPRAFITAADAGVEALCWFSMEDSVDGPMGLIDNNHRPRKTFNAMRTMSSELGEATRMHHIIGIDHPTVGVQAYRFDNPDGMSMVAWNIDGTSGATVKNAITAHFRDVLGKDIPVDISADGVASIQLSRSPIYIDDAPDAQLVLKTPVGVAPVTLFP